MSEEYREFYYHQPFQENQRRNPSAAASTFPYSSGGTHDSSSAHAHNMQMFDPSSYLSFTEFLHGSADHNSLSVAFGLSPAVKEDEKQRPVMEAVGGGETPATPNSSISSSSTEAAAAAADEDSNKGKKESQVIKEDGEDTSKKE